MTSRLDKKGPELLMATPEMLIGLESIAKMFKTNHDPDSADFLTTIKTIQSKLPSITDKMHDTVAMLRLVAKYCTDTADHIEQLFPKIKDVSRET